MEVSLVPLEPNGSVSKYTSAIKEVGEVTLCFINMVTLNNPTSGIVNSDWLRKLSNWSNYQNYQILADTKLSCKSPGQCATFSLQR